MKIRVVELTQVQLAPGAPMRQAVPGMSTLPAPQGLDACLEQPTGRQGTQ